MYVILFIIRACDVKTSWGLPVGILTEVNTVPCFLQAPYQPSEKNSQSETSIIGCFYATALSETVILNGLETLSGCKHEGGGRWMWGADYFRY